MAKITYTQEYPIRLFYALDLGLLMRQSIRFPSFPHALLYVCSSLFYVPQSMCTTNHCNTLNAHYAEMHAIHECGAGISMVLIYDKGSCNWYQLYYTDSIFISLRTVMVLLGYQRLILWKSAVVNATFCFKCLQGSGWYRQITVVQS